MVTAAYTRKTVLEIINEVKLKLGVKEVTTLDTQGKVLLNYLNDVIDFVTDYGDWQELMEEIVTTASSSVATYSVNTSSAVKNIHEIAFDTDIPAMELRTIDQMRRWERTAGNGRPRNWAVMGVDTNGNPKFQVYPVPGSNENNLTFKLLVYNKLRQYTVSATAVDLGDVPPFPARMLVSGLLAKALLDESRGTQNIDYMNEQMNFERMLSEAYNRFNGDSGSDTSFVPNRR